MADGFQSLVLRSSGSSSRPLLGNLIG
uniref:Uncharacterized protein n=1 Tax=Arundo donax TaxID=35708 RepID=A0A0A9BYS5_ARUDO